MLPVLYVNSFVHVLFLQVAPVGLHHHYILVSIIVRVGCGSIFIEGNGFLFIVAMVFIVTSLNSHHTYTVYIIIMDPILNVVCEYELLTCIINYVIL